MAVAAAFIIGAALGLSRAVDGTVRSRVQAQNEADVQSIIDRLTAGMSPEDALQAIEAPDGTAITILDADREPIEDGFADDGIEDVATASSGREQTSIGSMKLVTTQRAIQVDDDTFFIVARRPMARAAQELAGPVRSIRTQLEQEPHPSIANAWQDVAAGVLQDISRTEQIIEELLLLTRLELAPRRSTDITDLGTSGERPR